MTIRLIGLSGSFREASLNTGLLRALGELAPDDVEVVIHDYADVPLYNSDLAMPPAAERLRDAIAQADGVVFAIPEYNYSIPGVLKNAIDWTSRPAYHSVYRHKPVAMMSAASSFVGGARGQQHMKNIMLGMGALMFPYPEILVGGAKQKFADGRLVDEPTRMILGGFVTEFAKWAREFGPQT